MVKQEIEIEESAKCNKTTARWRPVNKRLKTVHWTAHASPNAHNFFSAQTQWAFDLVQLVHCVKNYVFCEQGFAQLTSQLCMWWRAHTDKWKYCSHCLIAWSRLDSNKYIYCPARQWRTLVSFFPAVTRPCGRYLRIRTAKYSSCNKSPPQGRVRAKVDRQWIHAFEDVFTRIEELCLAFLRQVLHG